MVSAKSKSSHVNTSPRQKTGRRNLPSDRAGFEVEDPQGKGDHGNNKAIHEYSVGYPQQLVFSSKHLSQKIDIADHAAVKEIVVGDDMFNSPFIVFDGHLVEVPEKKEVSLPFLDILTGEGPSREIGSGCKDGEHHGNKTGKCKDHRRIDKSGVFFEVAE